MDLLKSWAFALPVWFLGSVVSFAVVVNVASADLIESTGGIFLTAGIAFLVIAATASTGALTHPSPARSRPFRHAAAALTIPLLDVIVRLGNAVSSAVQPGEFVAVLLSGVLGGIAGWRLADHFRPPERRPAAPAYGYPYY